MSFAKVEPEQMPRLAWCAGLLNRSAADELGAWVARQRYPLLQRDVSLHVMARETTPIPATHAATHAATPCNPRCNPRCTPCNPRCKHQARETKLKDIISDVEGTWGRDVSKVYFHVDKHVAMESHTVSRGRWGVSDNLLPAAEVRARAQSLSADERAIPGGGGGGAMHRIAALNLPERPNSQGEHWTISHDKGMNWNTWLRFKMKASCLLPPPHPTPPYQAPSPLAA